MMKDGIERVVRGLSEENLGGFASLRATSPISNQAVRQMRLRRIVDLCVELNRPAESVGARLGWTRTPAVWTIATDPAMAGTRSWLLRYGSPVPENERPEGNF